MVWQCFFKMVAGHNILKKKKKSTPGGRVVEIVISTAAISCDTLNAISHLRPPPPFLYSPRPWPAGSGCFLGEVT